MDGGLEGFGRRRDRAMTPSINSVAGHRLCEPAIEGLARPKGEHIDRLASRARREHEEPVAGAGVCGRRYRDTTSTSRALEVAAHNALQRLE